MPGGWERWRRIARRVGHAPPFCGAVDALGGNADTVGDALVERRLRKVYARGTRKFPAPLCKRGECSRFKSFVFAFK